MLIYSKSNVLLCLIATLTVGCATVEKKAQTVPPGQVVVAKPYGDRTKDFSNVRVVTAAKLSQGNAVNILTLAPRLLLGGGGPLYLEKTESYGELLQTNGNKPVPNPLGDGSDLVQAVQGSVNDFLKNSPEFAQKTYKKNIYISTPMARLIYEALTGEDSEKYRLHVSMAVQKSVEVEASLMGALGLAPAERWPSIVFVDCGYVSPQALGLERWAERDYEQLKTEIMKSGEICQQKIVGKLPELLSH